MKTLQLNKNSWHYWLTRKYRLLSDYETHDICSYSSIVLGACLLTLILFVLSCLGIFMIVAGLWVLAGLLFHFSYPEILNGFAIMIGVFLLTMLRIRYHEWKLNRMFDEDGYRIHKPDNFLKHAYQSWKQKFCIKVEFK